MAGAELLGDFRVVLGALVHVFDQQADRGSRGHAVEHTGQNLDLIRFLTLGGVFGLAGAALVQMDLNIGFAQRQTRRAAVDHAAKRGPMAFAEGREPKQMAEGVMGHGAPLLAQAPDQTTEISGASTAFMPTMLYPQST